MATQYFESFYSEVFILGYLGHESCGHLLPRDSTSVCSPVSLEAASVTPERVTSRPQEAAPCCFNGFFLVKAFTLRYSWNKYVTFCWISGTSGPSNCS